MSEVEEVTEEPFLPPTPGATVMIPVAVRTVVALARIGGGAGLPAATGKVGAEVTLEQAQDLARTAASALARVFSCRPTPKRRRAGPRAA